MSSLLSCSQIRKSFGARTLFDGVTLHIGEGERIGMLGPNGSGKSTLLKIFAGEDSPDDGEVSMRKGAILSYLPQDERFDESKTVLQCLLDALPPHRSAEEERWSSIGEVRSVVGLSDLERPVRELSGGWRKRLGIAAALLKQPDILLLDEPTNHLDLQGIAWLERFILGSSCALVIVSHDRVLLENVTTRVVEINKTYPQGFLSIDGNYSRFLEKREQFLEGLSRYEESLRNKVRREIEWLRRGAKARSTKAKGRIKSAHQLIDELSVVEQRSASQGASEIDFAGFGRKTKKLLEAKKVTKAFGGRPLFEKLELLLSPGVRVGVVGSNGSGKSTLLRVLGGLEEADSGTVVHASQLRIVTFDQHRRSLDREASLHRALAPEGDEVHYRGKPYHVASWAKRFRFRAEQLEAQVKSLSGGEQARLLIAKLMLLPADVLLLDEPTNDLDIETLEVLEESLEEFPGAIILVTHDRFMLDRVSTIILGLDGKGTFFASYAQWQEYLKERGEREADEPSAPVTRERGGEGERKKKLSYKEHRELTKTEERIEELEGEVAAMREELSSADAQSDANRLSELCTGLATREDELQRLIERWGELEALK